MKNWVGVLLMLQMSLTHADTLSVSCDVGATDDKGAVHYVFPKGSEGRIVQMTKLPSGNYALQIQISKIPGDQTTTLHEGDTAWVYYHMDVPDPTLEVYDKNHQKKLTPDQGYMAKVIKYFHMQNAVSRYSQREDCKAIGTIQGTVLVGLKCLQANEINDKSMLDASVEEVRTYLDQVTKNELDSIKQTMSAKEYASRLADQRAANAKIAKNVVEYSKEQKVPISWVLGLMHEESHFDPNAKNKGSSATGLMQITRITAKNYLGNARANLYQIETNIKVGIATLHDVMNVSGVNDDFSKVMIGYGSGIGCLRSYLSGRTKCVTQETKNAIPKVEKYVDDYEHSVFEDRFALNAPSPQVSDKGGTSEISTE